MALALSPASTRIAVVGDAIHVQFPELLLAKTQTRRDMEVSSACRNVTQAGWLYQGVAV